MYGKKRKSTKRHKHRKRARKSYSGKRLSGRAVRSAAPARRSVVRSTDSGWSVKTTPFSFGKYNIPGFSYSQGGKTVSKEIEASGQHNDMDKEVSRIKLGYPRRFFKEFGKWTYTVQRTYGVQSTLTGTQAYGALYCVGSTKQICGTAIAAGVALGIDENRNNYFDLNPNQTTTGGAAPGLTVNIITPAPDKVVLKDIDYEVSIFNSSSVSTEVLVMWMMCKENSANDPITSWTNALYNQNLAQSLVALPATAGTVNNFNEGYGNPAFYGMHPYHMPEFKRFWKIVSTDKFILPCGDTHRIKKHIAYHKIIDKAYALSASNGYANKYLKGYTLVPVIIARGAVVQESEASGASYTYGTTKLGIVTSVRHTLASIGQGRISYQRIAPGIVGTSLGNEKQFNDVDNAVNVTNL